MTQELFEKLSNQHLEAERTFGLQIRPATQKLGLTDAGKADDERKFSCLEY